MLRDPFADIARRAWLPCPNCDHGDECATCQDNRTCDEHWQYLLSNQGPVVHMQCPTCLHLWQRDTRAA
jgi:hypothetical protein